MNILYINHYAGSPAHGMEFRPYYLAREWINAGHRVRILAAAYSHVRAAQPAQDGKALRSVKAERIDGIEYVWYPAPVYVGNGLGRVRNIWAFLRQVWSEARALAREFKPDAVIASSTYPMDIWVARRIARLSGARLVHEVHDLWPLSPMELSGMSARHPFIRICQLAEDTACRDADVVVSMLPNAADHFAAHGLDLRKLHVVPNGAVADDWTAPPAALDENVQRHLAMKRSQGRFVVGYAGSHGAPNALDVLIDAAARMRDDPVDFVFVGDGHLKQALVSRASGLGLQNVAFFPPIPKSQIPTLLSSFDAAFLGAPRSQLYRFGVSPNKLIDYMMGGVPVLYAIEAGNDPVRDAGCGITVPAADPKALEAAIRNLMAMDGSARRAMGARGRPYATDNHLYSALAAKFLAAMTITPRQS